jgi:extradiol dioxygenase family protein
VPDVPRFHLAVPVDDLGAAERFYGVVLGCAPARRDDRWIDWNLFGHQLVTHLVDGHEPPAASNPVDGHDVPVPHFGVLLDVDAFHELAARLRAQDVDFVIEPHVRFEGAPGEQWTMFFRDPAGNAIECKAFAYDAAVFRT